MIKETSWDPCDEYRWSTEQLKGQALLAVISPTPTGFRTPDSSIPAIPFSVFHVLGLPADIQWFDLSRRERKRLLRRGECLKSLKSWEPG